MDGVPGPGERDVLVIPAKYAWDFYLRHGVYLHRPNYSFKRKAYLAFYCKGKIEVSVPRIIDVVESVELTEEGVRSCSGIGEPTRVRLVEFIRSLSQSPDKDRIGEKHEVLVLSASDSSETIKLPQPVANNKLGAKGNPYAFTVGHRYVSLAKLRRGPKTTSELED